MLCIRHVVEMFGIFLSDLQYSHDCAKIRNVCFESTKVLSLGSAKFSINKWWYSDFKAGRDVPFLLFFHSRFC